MTLSPVGALDMAGTLYATSSSRSKVVHLSEECLSKSSGTGIRCYSEGGETGEFKHINHRGEIPLRARVCSFCDPTEEPVR